ncbi:MAG TPA: HDIG domain-containing protein [Selenomonadales bacterium]|nr:HDIG domain-containing protein [Selenomonadales bacterium]
MIELNNKLKELFSHPNSLHARPLTRRIVLGLAFFSLFMVLLSTDFISDKVSLQAGQVSDRDVLAPRSVSYVDRIKTKRLEAEILSSVSSVYDFDVTVATKAEENVASLFKAGKAVAGDKSLTTEEQKVDKLKAATSVALPDAAVVGLVSLDEADLTKVEEYTKSILRKYYQRGIREDDMDATRTQVVLEAEELGLGKNAEAVVAGVAQALLKPNFVLNRNETEKRKAAALASIEPVRETVKKGQVVVRRGDVVTDEQIHAMEELGLHRGQINEVRIFGLAIFVLATMGLTLGYIYRFSPEVFQNDLSLVLLGLILLLTLLLGKVAHIYSNYAAPMATGALLTAILLNPRLGLFVSIVLSLLFGIIVEHELRAVVVSIAGCLVGVYAVTKMSHGYSLTRTGLWIAVMNFAMIAATGFLEQISGAQILVQGFLGVFSGILSAVITIGVLPYLENSFNVTTPFKLLELASPSHPLLQRLLLDAPGTYHHSILVGNLAETAADMIGADPVVVRVGAYYHDIGKIKRPYFFIENQVEGSENPHDKIAPSLSTLIVTSHIKDGVDICREYKLPQAIVDVVQQHHGTTLVSYFYRQATETDHGDCIIEADFRYEGPRPQSKEVALIMLADACEAAVRSLAKPNVNRIEATVRRVIRERLNDGQLDDCNLTLKDLNTIGDVFIRVLSSMFHSRIEYPENLKELERRKPRNGNGSKQCPGKDSGNCEAEQGGDGRPG